MTSSTAPENIVAVCPRCKATVVQPREWITDDTGTAPPWRCACGWTGTSPLWVYRTVSGDFPVEGNHA